MHWLPYILLGGPCWWGKDVVSEWFVKVTEKMFFENVILCK